MSTRSRAATTCMSSYVCLGGVGLTELRVLGLVGCMLFSLTWEFPKIGTTLNSRILIIRTPPK